MVTATVWACRVAMLPPPLGQLLLRAFRWFDESLIAALHAAGWPELTRAHSLVFAQLDTEGTRTAELARRAGISRQAIHQTIQELQRLGLVGRLGSNIDDSAGGERLPQPRVGDGELAL
jgi:DNA-binding MarR family transcriptional regulator